MNTTIESSSKSGMQNASTLADVKVNVKIKLSALWITLMFLYIYADILGFYSPGTIENVILGEIGGSQITDGFLFLMAIWMALPSVMVFLSLTLKATANRWVNIIVGIVSIVVLGATFFVGDFSARYAFHAVVEGVLIALRLWYAWKWPEEQVLEATPKIFLKREISPWSVLNVNLEDTLINSWLMHGNKYQLVAILCA